MFREPIVGLVIKTNIEFIFSINSNSNLYGLLLSRLV